jgi:hypothetical protein
MSDVRWLALLPDPVTGLDKPVEGEDGQPLEWLAPNREMAIRRVRRDLSPAQVRLMSVVSVLDWSARQSSPQRAKLTTEPKNKPKHTNPACLCKRCRGYTYSPYAEFCGKCRKRGPKPRPRTLA